MPAEVTQLIANLAEIAVRNTASAVTTRVQSVLARRRTDETVNELVEIINDLVDDRNQLLGIARALEESLAAQRISDDDIQYIASTIIPTVEQFAAASDEDDVAKVTEPLKAVLSVETITVLQAIGFNFKAAIGEPLTLLLRNYILANAPTVGDEAQSLALQREVAYLEIAKDADAYDRLQHLLGP